MYMCVHVCVYVCTCVCMYMSVYVYAYTCILTRVGVHMHSCTRILFICTVKSLYYMRMYHRCLFKPACVCRRGLEVEVSMVSACCWCGRLRSGRDRDRGFVFDVSLFLRVLGWGVCVLVYARTYT